MDNGGGNRAAGSLVVDVVLGGARGVGCGGDGGDGPRDGENCGGLEGVGKVSVGSFGRKARGVVWWVEAWGRPTTGPEVKVVVTVVVAALLAAISAAEYVPVMTL